MNKHLILFTFRNCSLDLNLNGVKKHVDDMFQPFQNIICTTAHKIKGIFAIPPNLNGVHQQDGELATKTFVILSKPSMKKCLSTK